MTEALKKQVFEWIMASRNLTNQEIWALIEKAEEKVLFNFVKIVKQEKEKLPKETYLLSPPEEDKENEIDERPKKLPTTKKHSGCTIGNEIKEKDQHYNVKFILEQAGPTAVMHRQAPKEKIVDMSTVDGIAQYVSLKFDQISYGNHKSLVYYIEIARGLRLLMDKLRTGPNGKMMQTAKQVFPRILELTKVAESTFKSYQTFLSFMDDYPRFVHCNLTYNQIKENMGKFKAWFKSQPNLDANDFTSVKFWMVQLPEPVTELANGLFSEMDINSSDSNSDSNDFTERNPESDDEFVAFLRKEEGATIYRVS